jgi:DNA-binding NtrC family response regulator
MKPPFQPDDYLSNCIAGTGRNSPYVILFMDDEESILDSFGNLLKMKGYIVHTVSDGEQAVAVYHRALLSKQRVDVAIIDLTIPHGMGGIETVARIKEIDPGVQAIATTGHYQESLTDEYKKYGFVGILPKPYILKELLEVIDRVISAARNNPD